MRTTERRGTDSRFFHPVEGTFFGGFDESQPDERAEMASALFAVESELTYRTVPAVSLGTLFGETGMVDYLHSDIQGTEGDFFCSAMPAMDANVRVACIATHGRTIEKRLQDAFAPMAGSPKPPSPASPMRIRSARS